MSLWKKFVWNIQKHYNKLLTVKKRKFPKNMKSINNRIFVKFVTKCLLPRGRCSIGFNGGGPYKPKIQRFKEKIFKLRRKIQIWYK